MLNQFKNRLSKLEQSKYSQSNVHLSIQNNTSIIYALPNNKIYIPTSTGLKFHQDNSFIRLIMGPYGSGKSTMCCHEIVKRACEMPYWYNDRRRSRWAIVRNTSGELYSTTLQTWLAWFGELGDIKKRQKPLLMYEHFFNDGKGIVELEIWFIALDREEDVRKIKSLEVTGCYINELSEVPQAALSHFKGRLNGRYPSRDFCDESYWTGIIADTNPPDIDSWIYKNFEMDHLKSYKIFHQPPGLVKNIDNKWEHNYKCDNNERFRPHFDYYTKMAEGQSEEFIKVFCLGNYGTVGFGKLVYSEYNDDIHSIDEIQAIQGLPIHLGWDGGLTPACIVVQITERGRFLLLKEYTAEDMGIRTFVESIVIPGLVKDFPYNKIGISRADPSGIKRDEIMEELSFIGELNSLGITTESARTNDIDPRIAAVRFFLNRMTDGKSAFCLSRKGAPITRKGFIRTYCYKRLAIANEERYRNVPDKNMASHPHDALQYICLEFAADRVIKERKQENKTDMNNPVFRYL